MQQLYILLNSIVNHTSAIHTNCLLIIIIIHIIVYTKQDSHVVETDMNAIEFNTLKNVTFIIMIFYL